MASPRTLIYVVRRDLRVSDNPILHELATSANKQFTHLLPVYVFPADQVELSGFITDGSENPYPPAKSPNGKYWRCGPFRAEFVGQAVWDLQQSLQALGSGLVIRVGKVAAVVGALVEQLEKSGHHVGAVWMASHEGSEEKRDEKAISKLCADKQAEFKLWADEKYLIDDQDTKLETVDELPDVFTTYRKSVEPLREKPRAALPAPTAGSLPGFPAASAIAAQDAPFSIPEDLEGLIKALKEPVKDFLSDAPPFPPEATSAHPFKGGETSAQERLRHLLTTGALQKYKDTRNGLLGTEFSTKLSAFLAQGCITARQIHHALLSFEDGTDSTLQEVEGYGKGENEGTASVRFELLWRDYMRLCHRKYGDKLFRLGGLKVDEATYKEDDKKWKTPVAQTAPQDQDPTPERVQHILERFNAGTTGMGLIDASQRELLHTGYTSNRARQNVASFLSKHLGIDWRYGAEWYEMLLVDYDVSSNWANWQYVAGVGNDPRSEMRIFNPVKQGLDYDPEGTYTRSWVPELKGLTELLNVFQAWTASEETLAETGLKDNIMVTDPVKKIEFSAAGKPLKSGKRLYFRRKGRGGKGGADSPPQNESGEAGAAQGSASGTQPSPSNAPEGSGAGTTSTSTRGRGGGRGRGRGGNGARGGVSGSPPIGPSSSGNGPVGNIGGRGGGYNGGYRGGWGWRGGRGRGRGGSFFGGGRGQPVQAMAAQPSS
ncbi:putative cryptochrome [Echria macrotheca]|uniref:Cryptochrome DASH n=1 Tax=Echria macrotheca TaxID=438768 RepID=A0AAJ0BK61_9PEZI|nr:putative cryptochrome [Echria macrotheca]